MELINNRGAYTYKRIEELLLLYDIKGSKMHLRGEASFKSLRYNENMTFTVIENGINFDDFKKDNKKDNYLFLYYYVKPYSLFQTNIYPERFENKNQLSTGSHCLISNYNINVEDDVCICICSVGTGWNRISINGQTYDVKNDIFSPFFINNKFDISSSSKYFLYYFTKPNNEEVQAFTSSYGYIRIILPHIKDNYTLYKGFGNFENNQTYWHILTKYNVDLNSDKEIRLYFEIYPFNNEFPFQWVYGFDRKNYPENLKVEGFETNYQKSNIISSKKSAYFSLPNKFTFYKCKNKKVVFSIGCDFNNSFYKEVNSYGHFDFSNYSFYDILVIDAKEDFLLYIGQEDRRKNNNITIKVDNKITNEIEEEYLYIQYEQPFFSSGGRYVFAPNTDYYREKMQDECYLYNIFRFKNNDSKIIILDYPDLSQILKKKKYKEYIVTVVLSYRPNFYDQKEKEIYYFYNTSIIKVSQKLLDKDYNTKNTEETILIIFGIIFGTTLVVLLLSMISYLILCCIKGTTSPFKNLKEDGIIN